MNKVKRKLIALVLSLSLGLSTMPVMAYRTSGELDRDDAPTSSLMFVDAVLARPLLLVATAVGTVTFILTLPFSIPAGNVTQAKKHLVDLPANATFKRCLGCTYITPEEER